MSFPAPFHRWTGPTRVSRRSLVQSGVHFPIRRRYPSLRLTSGLITVRFPSPPSSYFSSYAAEPQPQPQPQLESDKAYTAKEAEKAEDADVFGDGTGFQPGFDFLDVTETHLPDGSVMYDGTVVCRYEFPPLTGEEIMGLRVTLPRKYDKIVRHHGLYFTGFVCKELFKDLLREFFQWCRKMFLEFVEFPTESELQEEFQ